MTIEPRPETPRPRLSLHLRVDRAESATLVPGAHRYAAGSRVVRFEALGIVDSRGNVASPGALLIEFVEPSLRTFGRWTARVLASGRLLDVALHEASCAVVRLPRSVLIPGLVNAHAHLDLTHVGPRAYDPTGGFVGWIRTIGPARLNDPEQVRKSVRGGVELAVRGGTVAVGDIAGTVDRLASLAAFDALRDTGLVGVSFMEFYAAGAREAPGLGGFDRALEQARARGELDTPNDPSALHALIRLGIQPHAPYSVSPDAYRRAFASASAGAGRCVPIATHLSESQEERRLVENADGPLVEFLESVGVWTRELSSAFGHGRSPVEHVVGMGLPRGALLAHVNHASARDIELLASRESSVVFCPRAWAYFGHGKVLHDHPYRAMLSAGLNVALGTDSIINLPKDVEASGVSVLDEMRELFKRDGTDPAVLLAMGTTHGARALGLPELAFTFDPGVALAGLCAVDVLPPGEPWPTGGVPTRSVWTMLMSADSSSRPELLFGGTFCGFTGISPVSSVPYA